jgi:hypothetical protein
VKFSVRDAVHFCVYFRILNCFGYYLYSDDTGKTGKVLFRTNSDNTVGNGVKA